MYDIFLMFLEDMLFWEGFILISDYFGVGMFVLMEVVVNFKELMKSLFENVDGVVLVIGLE